jgi:hypothetical protein
MPTSLRDLDSFGAVAAEEDDVLDYFLTTDAVKQSENQAFLVLAKGNREDRSGSTFLAGQGGGSIQSAQSPRISVEYSREPRRSRGVGHRGVRLVMAIPDRRRTCVSRT